MIKKIIIVFWVLCVVAALGFIPNPTGLVLKTVAVMLLLIHAIEFIVFEKTIKTKAISVGDSTLKSFLMTMLYGLFYFKF